MPSRWLILCVASLGCGRATGDGAPPPSDPAPAGRWGGAVTAPGGPAVGDVLFVDHGAVVAEAPIANGRYELAARPAAQLAVFRLEAPAVGVRELPITGAAPELRLTEADVIALHGAFELPAGVAFDWVDLGITPLAPTQPPAIVLWADAHGALRAAMTTRHLTSAGFPLHVLRGSYRIAAAREVDGPKGSTGPTLALDHAQLGAAAVPVALGGATVALEAPGELRLVLRGQ